MILFYKDGQEVRVGDIFTSDNNDQAYKYEVTEITNSYIYWKIGELTGKANVLSPARWNLVYRKGKPERKKNGFSSFILRKGL